MPNGPWSTISPKASALGLISLPATAVAASYAVLGFLATGARAPERRWRTTTTTTIRITSSAPPTTAPTMGPMGLEEDVTEASLCVLAGARVELELLSVVWELVLELLRRVVWEPVPEQVVSRGDGFLER